MTQEQEKKWREEARAKWREQSSQDNEGGVDSAGFIYGYLAARKAAQVEIDELTWVAENLSKDLKDRDQEIERLKVQYQSAVNGIKDFREALRKERSEHKKDLHSTENNFNEVNSDLLNKLKERDELIEKGIKYMQEGHDKFTPNVTNSFVLDWIEKARKILGEG